MGHAPQMRNPQAPQFVEAGVGRSAPKGGLRWLLQKAPRLFGGHVRQLQEVPAFVGEGGNDEAHSLRGRQVEL